MLVSNYGLAAVSILQSIYFLRVLSTMEVAVAAVLAIMVPVYGFSDLGLTTVFVQRAPAGLSEGGDRALALSLIKCALIYQTLAMLIIGAATVALAPVISTVFMKSTSYAWVIILFVPAAISNIWIGTLQLVAQVNDEFFLIAKWNFAGGLVQQVLPVAGYIPFGFAGFVIGTVVSTVFQVIGMGWSLRSLLFNDVPAAPFGTTFRYGLPFYVRTFMRFGFMNFDQAIVGALLSPTFLAGYSVARRIAAYAGAAANSFQTPVTTRMAALRGGAPEVLAEVFKKGTSYTSMIIIPLCVFLAAASPWVVSVYGGGRYAGVWPLVIALVLVQVGYAVYTNYAVAVFAWQPPRSTLICDGVVGIISFTLLPVAIRVLGEYGVAWGQVLGFAAGVLVCRALLRGGPELHYDFSSLRFIAVPLLLGTGVLVLGQVLYFRLWIVPLYGAAASAVLAGCLLFVSPWRGAGRQGTRALVPVQLLPAFDRVMGCSPDPRARGPHGFP